MGRQQEKKGIKNSQAAEIKGAEDAQLNSTFVRYCGAEVIAQIKRLALDPCKPQFAPDNNKPFLDQILRIKKCMRINDSHCNLRKRKHGKFINERPVTSSAFAVPNQQNTSAAEMKQLPQIPSGSCMVGSIASDKSSDDKICHESGNLSSLTVDVTLFNNEPKSSGKYMSAKVDSDESESGSMPSSLKKLKTDEFRSGSNPSSPKKLKSKATKKRQRENVTAPSKATRATKPLQPIESFWLQNLMNGYDVSKNVVPIGPRFQADVPEWNGPVDKNKLISAFSNDSNITKWLGTRTWPLKSRTPKPSEREVGQGRPNTCSCVSPGSVDCVKRHVLEDRKLLQSELGSAFFSWKFNEMGDQILKSWTVKEREIFDSMVKKRPRNGDPLKLTLKHLRNKCRADVVSYYFNVYIPELMSVQTRSPSPVQIDTDDDEEDGKYMGVPKRATGKKIFLLSKSKGMKTQKLRSGSSHVAKI